MPPPISDDEASDEDSYAIQDENPTKILEKRPAKTLIQETQSFQIESDKDEDGDDEDEDEQAPDEYVVEAILSHVIDEEDGEIKYEVKWEGYEKKSERTWEPESNLETAPAILEAYLAKVGGRELLLRQWEEKKASAAKQKKRGRLSTGGAAPAKKHKKKSLNPESSTPPAGVKDSEFKPPTGSWEDEVIYIDACEGEEGRVIVYLTWKGGQKTQHPLAQVYKRCPQKMLKFYERHLVFKKNDDDPN